MDKSVRKVLLSSLFLMSITTPVFANLTAVLQNDITPGTSGGPYSAKLYENGVLFREFQTFCVEKHVTYVPGRVYEATIDNVIEYGGKDPATLETQTQKLYAAFLNGGFTSGEWAHLQNAIWVLESGGDTSGLDTGGLDTADLSSYDTSGWQGVKVLNLWGNNGQDKQSHLVQVPAPGALILGILGTGLVGWKRRKNVFI